MRHRSRAPDLLRILLRPGGADRHRPLQPSERVVPPCDSRRGDCDGRAGRAVSDGATPRPADRGRRVDRAWNRLRANRGGHADRRRRPVAARAQHHVRMDVRVGRAPKLERLLRLRQARGARRAHRPPDGEPSAHSAAAGGRPARRRSFDRASCGRRDQTNNTGATPPRSARDSARA